MGADARLGTAGLATASVLGAGVLWGLISVFVRALTAAGLTSLQISAVRLVVGALGMALVLLVRDRSLFRIRPRDLWMFVGTGLVSILLFNACYFTGIQQGEASVAVVLLYTSPIFVMLMSAVIFHESVTPRKLVALVVTFAGCVLVSGVLGGGFTLTPWLLLLGIGSGFFYATYSIFGRFALRRYDPLTVTFYTFLVGAIGAIPLGNVSGALPIIMGDPATLAWCVGIGIVSTIMPYILYTWGLAHMETGRAAILATSEPLVGALLGILAYGESSDPLKLAGMALIFAAVVMLNVGERRDA